MSREKNSIKQPSPEQALSWLRNRFKSMAMPGSREVCKVLAREMEYRIPKQPIEKNYHFGGMFLPYCPTCGEFLYDEAFCPKCGQAIDWEDEHDCD